MTFNIYASGWVSSGGDGVVCFENKKTAELVEAEILSKKTFPRDYLVQIESVQSLETFETSIDEKFSRAEKAPSFEALIQERRELIQILAPLFYFQLQFFDEELNQKNWTAKESVPEIDDSIDRTLVRKKNPRCVLAQIFERLSLSRPNQKPLIVMNYQQELWSRLPVVDQALLYFHEALYTVGREIGSYAEKGHENSLEVRKVSRMILEDDFILHWEDRHNLMKDAEKQFPPYINLELAVRSLKSGAFQLTLNKMYGDFALLFINNVKAIVPESERSSKNPNQASRYESFYDFVNETKRFMDLCKKDPLILKQISPDTEDRRTAILEKCKFLTMHPTRIEMYFKTLACEKADEMAFLYMTRWIYDVNRYILPSEIFLVWTPGEDPSPSSEIRSQLKYACRLIQRDSRNFTEEMQKIQKRAERYCEKL